MRKTERERETHFSTSSQSLLHFFCSFRKMRRFFVVWSPLFLMHSCTPSEQDIKEKAE
jgi:hypothetical protein